MTAKQKPFQKHLIQTNIQIINQYSLKNGKHKKQIVQFETLKCIVIIIIMYRKEKNT